jgi:membrane fusion protein (multidrug efflux system)
VDGRVTKLSGNRGTYLQPGQSIMMFVPDELWVTANFKETQLDFMRPGQPVDISIDAFPDRTFGGHVDSLQSGSGTAFSLLPAENATGNYIKVVQRIPVKIVFDQKAGVHLGPGMSVVPAVKVRWAPPRQAPRRARSRHAPRRQAAGTTAAPPPGIAIPG